jgi:hypothetical protein
MITMALLGQIRRMKMREKLTIAKRTDLARNSVKRWLNAAGAIPKYLR